MVGDFWRQMPTKSPVAVAGPTPPAVPVPDSRALPAGALALVLRWDAAGRCCDVEFGGAGGGGRDVDDHAAALRGDGWLDLLHADDRSWAAERVLAVIASGESREAAVRLSQGERWAVLHIEPADDGDGDGATGAGADRAAASGVLVDATHSLGTTARMARLVEGFNGLRRPEDIVRSMLDEGITLLNGRTAVLYVLSDGDELVVAGSSGVPDEQLGARSGRVSRNSPLPAAEVLRTGRPVVVSSAEERRERYPQLDTVGALYDPAFVVVPLNSPDGNTFGAMGVGFADERLLRDSDRDFLEDVAAQCALALDRARLAAAAERDQERLAFLDRLSGTLASTLQLDAALAQLAGMTVPRIADWCVVRLVESTSNPRPVIGAAHVDPEQVGPLTRLGERIPRDLDHAGEIGDALRAGRPLVTGSRAARMLRPLFDDDDGREAMDRVGVEGLAIFPLRARGRLLGSIGFGNRPGRSFGADEFELAQLAAQRAAVIVDNARLFDEQSRVARALQDSLLPGSLPEIPGIELGARYRAAGSGLDVGGDFYDAFQADANWWIVAVGDVCGHGVEAAATTGLVRHTIRTAAMAGVMPSAILARLNQMLMRHAAEWVDTDEDHVPISPRFCTVLVGAVQPTDRGVDLILCSGGHPLPLVRRTVGRVDPVGVPGTLLGVTDEVHLTDTVVHLDGGEALVCYTDGLIDRRAGKRAFGEEGVVKALYQGKGLSAPDLARLIESEAVGWVDDEPIDDMAVLTLRAVER
jgi:serine phosphatase RsbU (regulator of sigma subunit)